MHIPTSSVVSKAFPGAYLVKSCVLLANCRLTPCLDTTTRPSGFLANETSGSRTELITRAPGKIDRNLRLLADMLDSVTREPEWRSVTGVGLQEGSRSCEPVRYSTGNKRRNNHRSTSTRSTELWRPRVRRDVWNHFQKRIGDRG